jgi:DNA-binding PadR family transcriptional regulator
MALLSRTEEIILAAVWKLQGDAYGVTINDYIREQTGLNWRFGSIYTPLGRLVKKNLLRTIEGEPTSQRGGRRKIFFELTEDGKEALREVRRVHTAIWLDMPALEKD